eukprot:266438-Amorphochlora_amoeboformis.AAC.1
MKIDKKSKTSGKLIKEEEGVVKLRAQLREKKGARLAKVLKNHQSWPWSKVEYKPFLCCFDDKCFQANFPDWVDIINNFDDHLEAFPRRKAEERLIIEILRFTELLISNSSDPGMYNSHEFKHTGCRGNTLLSHAGFKRKVFSLATGFCVPESTQSLRDICKRGLEKAQVKRYGYPSAFANSNLR